MRMVHRCCNERRVVPFDCPVNHNPQGLCRHGSEGLPMWKKTTVTVTIKINLASCFFGIAAILSVLM
jgi:hypothetical protein